MRLVTWPTGLDKFARWSVAPVAHTREHLGTTGHGSYERGLGARVAGRLDVVPMCIDDALTLRAFFHSLRGPSGTFYMPMPLASPVSALTTTAPYTDNEYFTDGTTYEDLYQYVSDAVQSTTLFAGTAADADTIVLNAAPSRFVAGSWAIVGTLPSAGQLVQIVTVSGFTATVRPRLRAAYLSSTAVSIGAVSGLFRLASDPPELPLIPLRSAPFSVDIEEAY